MEEQARRVHPHKIGPWGDIRLMNVHSLLAEYDLDIDDVRWYLAKIQTERLLEYRERRFELIRLIWSGKLEADLYQMEERFLKELQDKLDTKQSDESEIRNVFSAIRAEKNNR